jgi:hypothetical protein
LSGELHLVVRVEDPVGTQIFAFSFADELRLSVISNRASACSTRFETRSRSRSRRCVDAQRLRPRPTLTSRSSHSRRPHERGSCIRWCCRCPGGLLRGEPVPRRRLNPRALEKIGEPLDGGDFTLTDELARRVGCACREHPRRKRRPCSSPLSD